MHVLASALIFTLDTFLVCLGIGWRLRSWRERLPLAVTFGLCDATATALGSAWRNRGPESLPELATFGVYLLCAWLLGQLLLGQSGRSRSAPIYLLPVLLSVDNLLGRIPAQSAPILGLSSAVMALLGLSLAAAFRRVCMLVAREAEA